MKKLFDALNLLGQGRMVANPEFWKKAQSEGQPALAALLIGIVALLKGTPYEIPINDQTLGLIAGGIFAGINWVLTRVTTTKDVSVLPIRKSIAAVMPKAKPEPAKEPDRVQPKSDTASAATSNPPTSHAPKPNDPYFGD